MKGRIESNSEEKTKPNRIHPPSDAIKLMDRIKSSGTILRSTIHPRGWTEGLPWWVREIPKKTQNGKSETQATQHERQRFSAKSRSSGLSKRFNLVFVILKTKKKAEREREKYKRKEGPLLLIAPL